MIMIEPTAENAGLEQRLTKLEGSVRSWKWLSTGLGVVSASGVIVLAIVSVLGPKLEISRTGAAKTQSPPALSREASDALTALRDLRSVLTVGVNYQNYLERVGESKIRVDRYLAQPDERAAVARKPLIDAVELYRVAGVAWKGSQTYTLPEVRRVAADPALDLCEELAPLLTKPLEGSVRHTPEELRGLNAMRYFRVLWNCAAKKVAEAESVIDGSGLGTPKT